MAPNHPLDPAVQELLMDLEERVATRDSGAITPGTSRDSGHDTAENGGFAAVEHVGKHMKTTILDQIQIFKITILRINMY